MDLDPGQARVDGLLKRRGPIVPGVTASVLVGLGLGLKRGELGRWMTIGIAVMFALYCGGLWLLIEVVGLE